MMSSKNVHFSKVEKLLHQKQILQKTNRALRAKLKSTQESRAKWKSKYALLLQEQGKGESTIFSDGAKAKHYSYNLLLVAFCANIQAYGAMSLRSCVHVLFCLQLALGIKRKIPCASSIRMWVCKLGKYRIENQRNSEEKWIYWVDESIHIGNEKILLVLGIPERLLDFKSTLSLCQLRVLFMETSSQWKGEDIAATLQKLQTPFPLAYVVSDGGNNLQKSYRLADILHIGDCTHLLSKGIEKAYKGTAIFEEFCHFAGGLRQKWSLTKDKKAYLPPSQRNKVRFANLFPLVDWASKQLHNWEHLPDEVRIAFGFLRENKEWVLTFKRIQEKVLKISLLLKVEGFSLAILPTITAILDKGKTKEEAVFSTIVQAYLTDLTSKLGMRQKVYCCSDVIESAFGKLKQKLPKNSPVLSSFIFTLASIGGQYHCQEVKEGLEKIKDKAVKIDAKYKSGTSKMMEK